MLELIAIKQELEGKGYHDTNSLFELKVLLMNTASFLTKKHISNFKSNRDVNTSAMLLKAFTNVRNYYHVIETNKQAHEQCFYDIKKEVLTDISNLLHSHSIIDYKVIPLQNITGASLGMAK
jgi:hypothetical protein